MNEAHIDITNCFRIAGGDNLINLAGIAIHIGAGGTLVDAFHNKVLDWERRVVSNHQAINHHD